MRGSGSTVQTAELEKEQLTANSTVRGELTKTYGSFPQIRDPNIDPQIL